MYSARSLNPPNMVSIADTKVCTSRSSWLPMILVITPVTMPNPALSIRNPDLPPSLAGATSSRSSLPSRKRLSRCGASRKSSADLLGGVSTTIRSHSSARRSWPSFSIAMYSCVPAKLDDSD